MIKSEQGLKKNRHENDNSSTYEVAGQWKLMWWKFRKHKLAMVAMPIIIIMYILTMCCEFFAPAIPLERYKKYKECPPTAIHLFYEGKFVGPYTFDIKTDRDPYTFETVYVIDTENRVPLGFFVHGYDYKFWGLFDTDLHFFGAVNKGDPFFIMGTDELGRDLYTRILYGGRISLSFCIVSVLFTFFFGLTLGGLSGYLGGVTDTVIQRSIDVIMAIPTIPLYMSLAAALPSTMSSVNKYLCMCIIMSFVGWTGLARVVRGKLLSLREEDFVTAARLSGASHRRVIAKHMLPSFMSYIIVSVTASIPGSILGETTLSFLGLGLQAPTISWGTLLQDCQTVSSLAIRPWLLWPAAFIVVTVLMFNFAGDGLRDAADPYK